MNFFLFKNPAIVTLLLFGAALHGQTTRTVCASGCNHTTIAAAVAAAASGDIIRVNTTLHTENGVVITDKNLTIKGNGIAATTVQGHPEREMAADRLFRVEGTANVTFEDIKLQHGFGEWGGAIYTAETTNPYTGNLTLNRVHFYRNDSKEYVFNRHGGAFYYNSTKAGQTVSMTDCVFEENACAISTEQARGGAIFANGIALMNFTAKNCRFSGNTTINSGGAVYNGSTNVRMTFTGCTFEDNKATFPSSGNGGGAIFWTGVRGGFYDCMFKNNATGGNGGAIRCGGGSGAPAFILSNCTFFNNSAQLGGALWRLGANPGNISRLVNNTFSGNKASTANGGNGIYLDHTDASSVTQIVNCIFNHPASDIHFKQNLGSFTGSAKNYGNFITGTTSFTFNFSTSTHTLGLAAAPANNGGPTETLALLPTSTLVNLGANTATGLVVPIKDQRNNARTDAGIDLGAYERDGVADDASAPTIAYSPLGNTPNITDRTLTATITDANGVYGFATLAEDLRPRIYFRKNTAAWQSAAGTLTSGTGRNGTWDFKISSSAMGGLTSTDQVCYYVVAQDVSTVVNVVSRPSGAAALSVNNVTTPPTPNCYLTSGVSTGAEPEDKPALLLAPNPTSGAVLITLPEQALGNGQRQQLSIVNALGWAVWQQDVPVGTKQLQVDLRDGQCTNGLYWVVLTTEKGVLSKKLTLNNNKW